MPFTRTGWDVTGSTPGRALLLGVLYGVNVRTENEHLKKICADSGLQEDSVIRKFRITASDGKCL